MSDEITCSDCGIVIFYHVEADCSGDSRCSECESPAPSEDKQ